MTPYRCRRCGGDEHYLHKRQDGGWQRTCKPCAKKKARENYRADRTIQLERSKRWNRRTRERILDAYGRRCACCGEDQEEFLAVDHINGDGAAHRRSLGWSGRGSKFYSWIVSNNFPDFLRLLCHNCNCARGFYGYCPHEQKGLKPALRHSGLRPV